MVCPCNFYFHEYEKTLSFEIGIFFTDWKRSKINPVHKFELKHNLENYRPKSIFRPLEVIYKNSIVNYFNRFYYILELKLMAYDSI